MSDSAAEGVHRLIDMVVEEVSLVDRAANKHRFLIVKRNEAMDDNSSTNKATTDPQLPSDPALQEAAFALAEGSPLGAAVAALESLTAIVELLGSLGAESSDVRLAALAQQLRTTAEQILERTGFDGGDAVEAEAVTANAKSEESPAPSALLEDISAAKQALARLTELATKGLEIPQPKEPEASATPDVAASLSKLSESFRTLADTVKTQQERLGRVEKQFGMPNSAAPAERVSKAEEVDVGWPLDLNRPKDRESVDKAISFHDP